MSDRNPIVIPKTADARRRCAKCGSLDWYGRNISGAVTFKCKCGYEWYGGLAQVPMDPLVPQPPLAPPDPDIQFVENSRVEGGVEEIRKKPDMRTDFRKGAPIPGDEE
jgi:hypothetical protein